MALDPTTVVFAVAVTIALGYVGHRVFERTRVTDVLALVATGAVLGPVLGLLDPPAFRAIAPVIGIVTLLVILFDGGLGLDLRDLVTGLAPATLLAFLGWTLTAGAIGLLLPVAFGWDWTPALVLGAILGGSSSIVIIPFVQRTQAADASKVALSVESALTDVLAIAGTLALIEATAVGVAAVGAAGRTLAAAFSVAVVLGLLAGLAWGWLWPRLEADPYAYMATLAAVLFLHVATELAGGSGPIAVLVFGVVLGNRLSLFGDLVSRAWEPGGDMHRFQGEIAFFVRAFFFVSLGVLVDLGQLADPGFLAVTATLLAVIVAARVLAVEVTTRYAPALAGDRRLLFLMLPRGLAAAVLAGLPAVQALPGTEPFVEHAFAVILLTNLIVTVGGFLLPADPEAGTGPGSVPLGPSGFPTASGLREG